MNELTAKYKQQLSEYDSMILEAIEAQDKEKLPDIRAKSEQVQETLNKMIEQVTYMKKETPSIRIERDSLLEKLRRIQRDYNEMILNTDDLETLRRIREQESEEGRTQLYRYIAFFLLLASIMIVYIIVMGSQRKDTTANTLNTPTIIPALT